MVKKKEKILLHEYENLLRAEHARMSGNNEGYSSLIEEIRKDVSGEYNSNIDEKIERWITVTRAMMWKKSQSVEFYIQAKMLYRDAFFEATIMMTRSVCEMICYELLDTISHPFGTRQDMEKENFRQLAKFLFNKAKILPQNSFKLMNKIYDVGNNYIHPKSNQNPKKDSYESLLRLGEALWEIWGATNDDLKAGVNIETAYNAFPDICGSYHFYMDCFVSPQAALEDHLKIHKKSENN